MVSFYKWRLSLRCAFIGILGFSTSRKLRAVTEQVLRNTRTHVHVCTYVYPFRHHIIPALPLTCWLVAQPPWHTAMVVVDGLPASTGLMWLPKCCGNPNCEDILLCTVPMDVRTTRPSTVPSTVWESSYEGDASTPGRHVYKHFHIAAEHGESEIYTCTVR